MPDNGALALPFALAGRKISPKAGIIDSLIIPNGRTDAVWLTPLYRKTIANRNSNRLMADIRARLLSLDDNAGITLDTDITLIIAQSGTMSGGSRWLARLWAGGRGRRRRSRRGCRALAQASLHGLLAGWEVSLRVAIDKVGELALPEQGLLTDTAAMSIRPYEGWPPN